MTFVLVKLGVYREKGRPRLYVVTYEGGAAKGRMSRPG